MKTNHQRNFTEIKSRFDCGIRTKRGTRVYGLFGWEFTNGHRGHSRAKSGLKNHGKNKKKEVGQEILELSYTG